MADGGRLKNQLASYDDVLMTIRTMAFPSSFEDWNTALIVTEIAKIGFFFAFVLLHLIRAQTTGLGTFTWLLFALSTGQFGAIYSLVILQRSYYHHTLTSGIQALQAVILSLTIVIFLIYAIFGISETASFKTGWVILMTCVLVTDISAVVISTAFSTLAALFFRNRGKALHTITTKEEDARSFTAVHAFANTLRNAINSVWPLTYMLLTAYYLALAFQILAFDAAPSFFLLSFLLTTLWQVAPFWAYLVAGNADVNDPHQADTGLLFTRDTEAYPLVSAWDFSFWILTGSAIVGVVLTILQIVIVATSQLPDVVFVKTIYAFVAFLAISATVGQTALFVVLTLFTRQLRKEMEILYQAKMDEKIVVAFTSVLLEPVSEEPLADQVTAAKIPLPKTYDRIPEFRTTPVTNNPENMTYGPLPLRIPAGKTFRPQYVSARQRRR